MRSKLFVPGVRAELFPKALASHADAISFDLEDSVIETLKVKARTNVADFLCSFKEITQHKTIIVRTNSLSTEHFEADVMAVAQPSLTMVNLPKVESANDILMAVDVLDKAEAANKLTKEIGIIANIESPKGLLCASEIATAHPRVAGLQLGLNDLFEALSFDRSDTNNLHATMFAVRMAAGNAGIFAYDGAYTDLHDEKGFCAEAEMAHRLGYWGKSCIHPCQIEPANAIFSYSDSEIAFARRILAAAQSAEAEGIGVFTLDGKMIDLPFIRRAESILAASEGLHGKSI